MSEIELSYVTIRYKKPIVYFKYKRGAEIGFPEVKELIAYAEKLSNGKPYVTFSDVREEMNITEEGKRYVANHDNMPLFRGTAALVKNSMMSLAANIIGQMSRNKYPFKSFTSEEKAIEWLNSLSLDEI